MDLSYQEFLRLQFDLAHQVVLAGLVILYHQQVQ
jgi:hypothetical protein